MQIVDLEGRRIAIYEEQVEGKAKTDLLGNAFACYAQNPERFTFLETDDNNKLEFLIAEPASGPTLKHERAQVQGLLHGVAGRATKT